MSEMALVLHNENTMNASAPFLSVIIRTQGDRPEKLNDCLLSLRTQTNQNFEVFVVHHNSFPTIEFNQVKKEFFIETGIKITSLIVAGGSRGVPLNAALDRINGEYVSFLDDDDFALPNWVESFETNKADGSKILRAQALLQDLSLDDIPTDSFTVRNSPSIRAECYPNSFNVIDHLISNKTPFLSLAFPSYLFTEYELRVNPQRVVCEDWDLILRATAITSVTDIAAETCIYRFWKDKESSYTQHSIFEWNHEEVAVVEGIERLNLSIHPGSQNYLRERLIRATLADSLEREVRLLRNSSSWKMTAPMRRIASFFRDHKLITKKILSGADKGT